LATTPRKKVAKMPRRKKKKNQLGRGGEGGSVFDPMAPSQSTPLEVLTFRVEYEENLHHYHQ
jgi:hypothetical protein